MTAPPLALRSLPVHQAEHSTHALQLPLSAVQGGWTTMKT